MGRIIAEVCEIDGKGVADAWIEKELKSFDRARIETRFSQIERFEGVHPKWTPSYKSLRMTEIKVDYEGKAVRFLCHEDQNNRLIILAGCVKKGQIDKGTENRAVRRRQDMLEDKLNVRDYPLATR